MNKNIFLFVLFCFIGIVDIKSQVNENNDLMYLYWKYNESYFFYGNTIVPLSGTLSDRYESSYTNIAYKTYVQIKADIELNAKSEHWDPLKTKVEIEKLSHSAIGGRVYICTVRKNSLVDNVNYLLFNSIIKDINEKDLYITTSKFAIPPKFKNKNDFNNNGFSSNYLRSYATFDIDKEVPDSFYVCLNEISGQLNSFMFKVIPMPKMKKYVSFYSNSQVFVKGMLEKDLKTGVWTKYHPNGKVGVIEEYIDGKLNGQVIEYFDDGALAAEKEYKNGLRNGIWKQYYYKIWIDGKYKNDKKDSIWSYYDTIGNLTAKGSYLDDLKNGSWIYYYNNHKESEGSYINDVENGEWKIFDSVGIVIAKGMINKGEEVPNSWVYYDNENNTIAIDTTILLIIDNMPQYREGLEGAMMYIKNNINMPTTTTGGKISGKIFVSFVVEPIGTLSNIILLKGLSTDIDNEIIRIFNKMPRWIPGYQNGRLVRVKVNMPISIDI